MDTSNSGKIISVAIIIAALIIGFSNRYEISGVDRFSYVVDKLTGRVWGCHPNGCRRLEMDQ